MRHASLLLGCWPSSSCLGGPLRDAASEPLTNLTPPFVGTDAVFGERALVEPGTWSSEPGDTPTSG